MHICVVSTKAIGAGCKTCTNFLFNIFVRSLSLLLGGIKFVKVNIKEVKNVSDQ